VLTDRDLKQALDDLDVLIRMRERLLSSLIDTRISPTIPDAAEFLQTRSDGLREHRDAINLLKRVRRLVGSYRARRHRRF
jgi:hypothetical protein